MYELLKEFCEKYGIQVPSDLINRVLPMYLDRTQEESLEAMLRADVSGNPFTGREIILLLTEVGKKFRQDLGGLNLKNRAQA